MGVHIGGWIIIVSLIPEFELGVWNAWIFMLYQVISPLILWLFYRKVWKDVARKAASSAPSTKNERIFGYVITLLFYALVAYSVFLPLEQGTIWFFIGFFIYLVGVVFEVLTGVSFADTPLERLVTKGVYRISRNPMYFGQFLVCIGTGIACASWVFLLGGTAFVVLLGFSVPVEERFLLEKYGSTYQEYIDRTPRWIGIPKSEETE